jgi:predicted transcriptional regulator
MSAEDFQPGSGSMSREEASLRTLAELTDKEWAEIHQLAVKLCEAGLFKRNQFRCSIQAFVMWVAANDELIGEDFTADGGLH